MLRVEKSTTDLLKPNYNWIVSESPNELLIGAKFINSGTHGMAIVARVDRYMRNWTGYWGGCSPEREKDAYIFVAEYGDSMPEEHARHFFPEIGKYYRYWL